MKNILFKSTLLIFASASFLSSNLLAQVPNNSVGSKQIKANAVKTKKINAGAVTSEKLADGAVTGAKVASKALDHTKITEVHHVESTTLTNSQTVNIFEDGIITLQAKCEINSGGNDIAKVLVFSEEDGTAFDGTDTEENLTAATAEADRELSQDTTATTTASVDQESDGMIMTPSGAIYNAELIIGSNLFDQTGTCHFGGTIYKILKTEE